MKKNTLCVNSIPFFLNPTPRIALFVGPSVRDKISAHNILATKRATGDPTGFLRAFWIFQKIWNFGFLDFWISGFFWISGYISATKRPDFWGLFGFFKKIWNFGFLDFRIFEFFGFLAISRQQKEIPEIRWCQKDRIFESFLDFPKKYEILDFWISGFLDFWIFLDFWLYLSNEKS